MSRSGPVSRSRNRAWADHTWTEIRDLLNAQTSDRPLVAILPAGATEAHGPHLPLQTDRVIAQAMAERGAELLAADGFPALVLPPLDYTAAPFAGNFPGTLSIRPETLTALVVEIGLALARQEVGVLVLANAHLDPAHLSSLYAARNELREHPDAARLRVVFPDVTRKPWALRLTDEFLSGACHAGQYEGSVVLAVKPDLVRTDVQADLAPNPVSLSDAIRTGQTTFEEAGGDHAYFGDPAASTAAEGRETIRILGEIVAEAVRSSVS